MNPEIEKLEAAIAAAKEALAELKAAEAAEPKPWPQHGDSYYVVTDKGPAASCWGDDDIDAKRLAIGNVFHTKAEAEREIERRKVLTELRQLARESWGGEKVDWSNDRQSKWYLCFNHCRTYLTFGSDSIVQANAPSTSQLKMPPKPQSKPSAPTG